MRHSYVLSRLIRPLGWFVFGPSGAASGALGTSRALPNERVQLNQGVSQPHPS